MSTRDLSAILHLYNPWWVEGRVPVALVPAFRRSMFGTLVSHLGLNRFVVLKGPRRTGKTTILYQVIAHLIEFGHDPADILYFSFDEPEPRDHFDRLLKAYQEATGRVIGRGKPAFFFLDEIQNAQNWSGAIKRYFDRKMPITFVLSGSSASLLRKGPESLAGRTVEETLMPLGFSEFLLVGAEFPGKRKLLDTVASCHLVGALPNRARLLPYESDLGIAFGQFMARGGFPHLLEVEDRVLWRKLLREDVIEKVVYRDLVDMYSIKKPMVLEKLFLYLAEHSSQILNISGVSTSLGLSREFTEIYLDYLKKAYLVFTLPRFSRSIEKRLRAMEKGFIADPGLMQLGMRHVPGKVVETIVANHLHGREVTYWRESQHDVDFIVHTGKGFLPIESKYREEISPRDLKGILRFLEHTGQEFGIVVTKSDLEDREVAGKRLRLIPAWLFLLLPIEPRPGVSDEKGFFEPKVVSRLFWG